MKLKHLGRCLMSSLLSFCLIVVTTHFAPAQADVSRQDHYEQTIVQQREFLQDDLKKANDFCQKQDNPSPIVTYTNNIVADIGCGEEETSVCDYEMDQEQNGQISSMNLNGSFYDSADMSEERWWATGMNFAVHAAILSLTGFSLIMGCRTLDTAVLFAASMVSLVGEAVLIADAQNKIAELNAHFEKYIGRKIEGSGTCVDVSTGDIDKKCESNDQAENNNGNNTVQSSSNSNGNQIPSEKTQEQLNAENKKLLDMRVPFAMGIQLWQAYKDNIETRNHLAIAGMSLYSLAAIISGAMVVAGAMDPNNITCTGAGTAGAIRAQGKITAKTGKSLDDLKNISQAGKGIWNRIKHWAFGKNNKAVGNSARGSGDDAVRNADGALDNVSNPVPGASNFNLQQIRNKNPLVSEVIALDQSTRKVNGFISSLFSKKSSESPSLLKKGFKFAAHLFFPEIAHAAENLNDLESEDQMKSIIAVILNGLPLAFVLISLVMEIFFSSFLTTYATRMFIATFAIAQSAGMMVTRNSQHQLIDEQMYTNCHVMSNLEKLYANRTYLREDAKDDTQATKQKESTFSLGVDVTVTSENTEDDPGQQCSCPGSRRVVPAIGPEGECAVCNDFGSSSNTFGSGTLGSTVATLGSSAREGLLQGTNNIPAARASAFVGASKKAFKARSNVQNLVSDIQKKNPENAVTEREGLETFAAAQRAAVSSVKNAGQRFNKKDDKFGIFDQINKTNQAATAGLGGSPKLAALLNDAKKEAEKKKKKKYGLDLTATNTVGGGADNDDFLKAFRKGLKKRRKRKGRKKGSLAQRAKGLKIKTGDISKRHISLFKAVTKAYRRNYDALLIKKKAKKKI